MVEQGAFNSLVGSSNLPGPIERGGACRLKVKPATSNCLIGVQVS